jgi:hypothetical protein
MPPACGREGSAIRTFRQLFEFFFKWSNVAITQLRSWNQCLRS